MLGKLLKHEFKATAKLLIPLNLIVIAITIIGRIILSFELLQNDFFHFLNITLTCIYSFSLIALFIVTFVYLVVRFYKNLYGNEGYLMHTLPVSSTALLNAKLITSICFGILTSIVCAGSLFALLAANLSEDFNYAKMARLFELEMGISFTEFWVIMVLSCILAIILFLIKIYACISIGQLFEKHKILAAVIAYLVVYVIMQMISSATILLGNMKLFTALSSYDAGSAEIAAFYRSSLLSSEIESVIFIVIFYLTAWYIMKKKVNLD